MPTECPTNTIDSNITGLRIAEEVCLKRLPTAADDGHDPVWRALEPNTYSDFGGQITTVARNPINPSRQRKKGVITDMDASGGYNQDVTQKNTTWLMQGMMFASAREKPTTAPLNTAALAVGAVDAATKTVTLPSGGAAFLADMIVLASGFGVPANNGLKTVASSTALTVVMNEVMADEAAPPASAKLTVVGFTFPADDVALAMNGALVQLVSTATDMTTLGLIPGEWLYLGGDISTSTFTNNHGFARIGRITSTFLEFDKVGWETPAAESGAGKSINVYLGTLIQNEQPGLIKRRTYQLERTLGNDADGTMSEYLVGSVPNEFTLNIAQASKVTADFTFVACDNEQRSGSDGLKPGTRPLLEPSDAFNTSSDIQRIKLSTVDSTASTVSPLFAFTTEVTLTIKNNVGPNKAVGVLGAFETSTGTFEVGGSLTAYFADILAARAVRNNDDITIDFAMVSHNAGLLFDVPLLSLGGGRIGVEPDRPITLPLESNAAESKFGTTLVYQDFQYLPNAAEA